MSIETQSVFRYGVEITSENNILDMQIDGDDVAIEIPKGSYCSDELVEALKLAFKSYGYTQFDFTYTNDAYLLTISSNTGTFTLYTASGLNAATSAYPSLGFETDSDVFGVAAHTAVKSFMRIFSPQFMLQSFVDCDQNKRLRQATKNTSADGECCEVIHCGEDQFFEFNIKGQTNIKQTHRLVPSKPGYDQLRDFMDWAICAKMIEFYPDCTNTSKRYKIKLERTPGFKDGTGYELIEMIRSFGCGYYETGNLEFRVLEKPL